jgi:hypothetical protein
MLFRILLGYDYWMALMLEDAGVPPSSIFPLADIGRVAFTFTFTF